MVVIRLGKRQRRRRREGKGREGKLYLRIVNKLCSRVVSWRTRDVRIVGQELISFME